MKALEKKLTGIYVPGYTHANSKKYDSSYETMVLDVIDTDEDRIMYRYNSPAYGAKSKQSSRNQTKSLKH